jgi:hypothetical protein
MLNHLRDFSHLYVDEAVVRHFKSDSILIEARSVVSSPECFTIERVFIIPGWVDIDAGATEAVAVRWIIAKYESVSAIAQTKGTLIHE